MNKVILIKLSGESMSGNIHHGLDFDYIKTVCQRIKNIHDMGIGIDAVRYFFVKTAGDSHMDFDLDLAVSQSNENPVYYAQYACQADRV